MSTFSHTLVRYSRFVTLGKRLMWLFALVLIAWIVATAWINTDDETARIVVSGGIKPDENNTSRSGDTEASVMMHPRYHGVDDENRPYSIVAEKAIQEGEDTIRLETLSADMEIDGQDWTALTASEGLYRAKEKALDLKGNVHLFYEGGYEFRTEQVAIDVAKSLAVGDSRIEGQGPGGTLEADTFKIIDQGAILQFNGNVHVVLYL